MGIQSVDRALEVLDVLATRGTAGTGEVAEALDVHKSTASRLLASLAERDLVTAVGPGGPYRLGFGLVRLASAVTSRMDFSQVAQQLSERVAAELHLTANVAVLDDVYAVNVAQAVGDGLLAPRHYVGLRTPGHATSSGKVLLASSASAARQAREGELPAFTERTLTSDVELDAELSRVARQGWAASNEEWEDRITAVAVPLVLPDGRVEAALTVTGPTHTLPPERFAEVATQLRALAASSGRWTSPAP